VTSDPAALADAARALADHLRFQQALGTRALPFAGEPLGRTPAALGRVEQSSAGCTKCKLSRGRTTIVFGSGAPEARLLIIGEGPGEEEDRQGSRSSGARASSSPRCWSRSASRGTRSTSATS
jgi:hypothetical protein